MTQYVIKFKKGMFWRQMKVVGHNYNKDLDRLAMLLENGGVYELAQWSKYDSKLGPDWAAAVKKEMEKQAGQAIPIDRKLDAN